MKQIKALSILFLFFSFLSIYEFSNKVCASPDKDALITRGKVLFKNSCSACHGLKGDGNGPVTPYLAVKPRKFTDGSYKFRSTPTGKMPTEYDLVRTITSGTHGASMPPFFAMDREDVFSLIAYVQYLSEEGLRTKLQKKVDAGKLDEEGLEKRITRLTEQGIPLRITTETPMDEYSIRRGEKIFNRLACADCHGVSGRGDGPLAKDLKDYLDNPITPADFTLSGGIKSGKSARDIYRTFMTGINGTPMSSYADILNSDEAWDLAHYVLSLRRQRW